MQREFYFRQNLFSTIILRQVQEFKRKLFIINKNNFYLILQAYNREVERYKVIQVVNSTTDWVLFKALDLQSGDIVTIKRLNRQFKDWVQFLNYPQVKVLKKLTHNNIAHLLEVLKHNKYYFMVIRDLDTPLDEYIQQIYKQGRKLNDYEIFNISKQICTAINYIQSKGIVHTDIQIKNIFIHNDNIRLFGFDQARFQYTEKQGIDEEKFGMYAAPEILLQKPNISSAADIFSLGCLICQLYEGRPVLTGDDHVSQLTKYMKFLGAPDPGEWAQCYDLANQIEFQVPESQGADLKDLVSGAPGFIIKLLGKMLQINPNKRISATQILEKGILEFQNIKQLNMEKLEHINNQRLESRQGGMNRVKRNSQTNSIRSQSSSNYFENFIEKLKRMGSSHRDSSSSNRNKTIFSLRSSLGDEEDIPENPIDNLSEHTQQSEDMQENKRRLQENYFQAQLEEIKKRTLLQPIKLQRRQRINLVTENLNDSSIEDNFRLYTPSQPLPTYHYQNEFNINRQTINNDQRNPHNYGDSLEKQKNAGVGVRLPDLNQKMENSIKLDFYGNFGQTTIKGGFTPTSQTRASSKTSEQRKTSFNSELMTPTEPKKPQTGNVPSAKNKSGTDVQNVSTPLQTPTNKNKLEKQDLQTQGNDDQSQSTNKAGDQLETQQSKHENFSFQQNSQINEQEESNEYPVSVDENEQEFTLGTTVKIRQQNEFKKAKDQPVKGKRDSLTLPQAENTFLRQTFSPLSISFNISPCLEINEVAQYSNKSSNISRNGMRFQTPNSINDHQKNRYLSSLQDYSVKENLEHDSKFQIKTYTNESPSPRDQPKLSQTNCDCCHQEINEGNHDVDLFKPENSHYEDSMIVQSRGSRKHRKQNNLINFVQNSPYKNSLEKKSKFASPNSPRLISLRKQLN